MSLHLFTLLWCALGIALFASLAVWGVRKEAEAVTVGDMGAIAITVLLLGLIWPISIPMALLVWNKDRVIWRRK